MDIGMAVIDFHSHILPGIDDGSKNVEMSIEMLHMAMEQRIDFMIATPHFYASRHRVEDFLGRRERAYERLKERMPEGAPKLRLGAEVAYFPGMSRAEKLEDLTVEGTNLLLLELPFVPWDDAVLREVRDIIKVRKFQVMLAHLERYTGMAKNRKRIDELLRLPLYVQINAESLLSFRTRRPLVKMFDKGQAHFLGSDCHRIERRQPNLGRGRDVLRKKLGEDFLKTMDENGSRLLQLGGYKDV